MNKKKCANHCPKCKSKNIDYSTFEWFDDRVEYPASCLDCKADFVEVYTYDYTESK
jgi:predicted Zn-ribbon and HTH transcriptional regulator